MSDAEITEKTETLTRHIFMFCVGDILKGNPFAKAKSKYGEYLNRRLTGLSDTDKIRLLTNMCCNSVVEAGWIRALKAVSIENRGKFKEDENGNITIRTQLEKKG